MQQLNYDLAILGCGPAGLAAAVNATIRNKKVIVIGTENCSPTLRKARHIENYLGLPGLTGQELLQRFLDHAQKMDIEISTTKAAGIFEMQDRFHILVGNNMVQTHAVVIATGVPYKPTLPREDQFIGRGVGYCATCDGPLFTGKDIAIIGHNEEAEEEAGFMAEICRKVYFIPLYEPVGQLSSNVTMLTAEPVAIEGDEFVEGLVFASGKVISVEGIFVLGAKTAPDQLVPGLALENQHIKVNRRQETSIVGIFAAGDCTGKPYQVAKSIGEGQVAGLNAAQYVSDKLKLLHYAAQ